MLPKRATANARSLTLKVRGDRIILITRGKHKSYKQQLKYVLLNVVQMVDSLIIIGSLGFLNSELRIPILFSEWMES